MKEIVENLFGVGLVSPKVMEEAIRNRFNYFWQIKNRREVINMGALLTLAAVVKNVK